MKTTLLALAGAATMATANSTLLLDLNTVQAEVGGLSESNVFGETYSGDITVSDTSLSELSGVRIDYDLVPFTGSLGSFEAIINVANGIVTGGTITLEDDLGRMFLADIVPGSGDLENDVGSQFEVDGLIQNGRFTSEEFAGVDVSKWAASERLEGAFIQFYLNPNGEGIDASSDMDLLITVPAPAGVLALGAFALGRRRR